MNRGAVQQQITQLRVDDTEKLLLFAAARIFFLRKIPVEIQDFGNEVRLTPAVDREPEIDKNLKSLNVAWDIHYYFKKIA